VLPLRLGQRVEVIPQLDGARPAHGGVGVVLAQGELASFDADARSERASASYVLVRVSAAVLLAQRAKATSAAGAAAGERHASVKVDKGLAAARACERQDLLNNVLLDRLAAVGAHALALAAEALLELLPAEALELGKSEMLSRKLLHQQERGKRLERVRGELELRQNLRQKGRRRKVADAVDGRPAVYKWQPERKR